MTTKTRRCKRPVNTYLLAVSLRVSTWGRNQDRSPAFLPKNNKPTLTVVVVAAAVAVAVAVNK